MADDTSPERPFDEAKIAELLKSSQQDAVKAALAQMKAEFDSQQAQQSSTLQQQSPSAGEGDVWDSLINEKTASKFHQANLSSQIAQDVAAFYTSEFWNETVDEWLTGDDETARKLEKRDIRNKVEKLFEKAVKEGRPLPRADIAKFVLMEEIQGKKEQVEESITKKRNKKAEVELEKAQSAVDIAATTVANFTADDVYALSVEDLHKKFANLTF